MHAHHHSSNASGRLWATLAVTAVIMVAEVAGGLWSGSLALLADAGHMLTDLLALGVALAAVTLGSRPADHRRTYGYRRLEVLAAFINSLALVGVSVGIAYEAVDRWLNPQPLAAGSMMAIATIGLVANLVGLWLLGNDEHNMNVRGAFLHIMGDTLSSLGVLAGGAVIYYTGYTRIDPVLSVVIAVIIVVSSFSLLRDVINVLLEAAPRGISTEKVKATITAVEGVGQVHDLHIWSITSGLPALSAHVVLQDPGHDPQQVLCAIQQQLRENYGIDHATLQIEASLLEGCGCV